MTHLLATLLLCLTPHTARPTEPVRVDVIEHNTIQHGEDVYLRQFIFWDFDFRKDCYVVVDFRLEIVCGEIIRDRGTWRLTWREYDGRVLCVVAPRYFASVTTRNPEVDNRKIFHSSRRRRVRVPR